MPKPTKILTVDDSMLTRVRFIAAPLRAAGYEVIEAVNGQEGLDKFAEHQPDCVISDLLMPVMDGFQFVQALREQGVETPVIVASADIQASSRQRVEELGVSGFLSKPFSADELLAQVAAAVGAAQAEEVTLCS